MKLEGQGRAAHEALVAGNGRYARGRMTHPHQSPEWRREIAPSQHPIAAVVSCSDSRVPPEVVFDQGLGDLFVVRTAGNVLGDIAIGSIEYVAEHQHVPLIVVMGHTRCGAVTAACEDGHAPGRIASVVEAIAPSVEQARQETSSSDVVEAAARINVQRAVRTLSEAKPFLARLIEEKKLSVVGAIYDLETGKVEWLR